jgi:hypothetical protein
VYSKRKKKGEKSKDNGARQKGEKKRMNKKGAQRKCKENDGMGRKGGAAR